MTFTERIAVLYESGELSRLHTVRTIEEHSIARHVYGSMIVAVELCMLNNVGCGPVLKALLYHDAPEVETGDIPAPVKRLNPDLNHMLEMLERRFYKDVGIAMPFLGTMESEIVHAADTIDLAWTCLNERALGNKTRRLALVFTNCTTYLHERFNVVGVEELYSHLTTEWRNHGR